jgi:hypothetical protein
MRIEQASKPHNGKHFKENVMWKVSRSGNVLSCKTFSAFSPKEVFERIPQNSSLRYASWHKARHHDKRLHKGGFSAENHAKC